MKVLVSGADGFIGSHLVEMLLSQGHEVRALAQYNSFNHWGWLEQVQTNNPSLNDKLEIICGDVRDPDFCRSICQDINQVFHLAALIAIPYSYQAPASYVATNVQGSLNMLQASLAAGVERFIHTSTSEVYGTAQTVPIDENHPLQAQSPYSASKIGADALALSFFHSFDYPVSVARPFNTYGPRQSARAVIPTVISQIAAGESSIKLGDLTPTRDFNFVADTCRGFIALANCDKSIGEVINIGSGREVSIADTVHLIKKLMHSDIDIQQEDNRFRPQNSEVRRLVCDNTKIKSLTGFEAKTSLEQGLQKTIDWFTQPDNIQQYKTGIYNV